MDGTVEVARVQGPVEAELVRGLLESYGIAVALRTLLPQAVWPLTGDGLGEVGIVVAAEDAQAATHLIARHRQAGLVILDGDAPPRDAS